MRFRLRTVRAKLVSLVGLFAGVTLASLPAISQMLHQQLEEEVHERVTSAEKAFQIELDDDLADLTVVARVIANDRETERAVSLHDALGAERLAKLFVSVYPELDVLLMDSDGKLLAQVGCDRPPAKLSDIVGLDVDADGKGSRRVVPRGCEPKNEVAPPAYMLTERLPSGGTIVVCMPLGRSYLRNSSEKLGLELALAVVDEKATIERSLEATENFPPGMSLAAVSGARIVEDGDRVWGVARFSPKQLTDARSNFAVVMALDVSDMKRILRHHLLAAMGVVLFAALLSLAVGLWLAGNLSRPIVRVTAALAKLDREEYTHVRGIKTGDELELLATGFNKMVDGLRERDKLRATFGKYMTASVMEHLLSGKVQLGGESIRVTILFSDIRSFTSISETMSAQALVALLNEYFEEMVAIIMQEEGVVDKYIGDAVMAVFGAPVPKPGDAVRAVRAAVRMRVALANLNERLVLRGIPELRTGIGVHTGEVVAGNIGCERRMEYTVIGDSVNLASRLESETKELGAPIVISEATYLEVRDYVDTRPIREVCVKGRGQPVMTYEVLGIREGVLPEEPPA